MEAYLLYTEFFFDVRCIGEIAMSIRVKICVDWSSKPLEVDLPINRDCFEENHSYVCVGNDCVGIAKLFDQCKAVPDVDRYRALKKGNNICLDEHGSREICDSKYNDRHVDPGECVSSTIVFLLESPHKEEYKDCRPVAPAQGNAGRKIDAYLGDLLCHLSPNINDGSRIIISNPIQYQTSLSMILKSQKINEEVRDKIWNHLWKTETIKNNFLCRVKKYKPSIIINACTGGMREDSLRRTVSRFLQEARICVGQLYEINHPSSWNIPKFHKPNCLPESLATSQGSATSSPITDEDTTDAPDDNSETAPTRD